MGTKQQLTDGDAWLQHMRTGAFAEAWKISDAVLEKNRGKPCWHLPRHLQYIWNGTPLNNKRVLIRCYHGLGDTIQFIRFVAGLKAIAKEIIVWAQPELITLLQTIPEIDALLPLHNGSVDTTFDVDVEVMELTHVFKTTIETLPSKVPYLHAEPLTIVPKSEKPVVGLVWKAGGYDEGRDILFETLKPLFSNANIEFVILQANAIEQGWQQGFGYYPGPFNLENFARVIKSLDLLVSVDSMPVHLAGALGKPVWNLLQKNADWRWMKDRDDSPWYPTMRLFRQHQQGDWDSVIDEVAVALEAYVASGNAIL